MSRTERAWVVVNREGRLVVDTVASRRSDSIHLYAGASADVWASFRRNYGVRVKRCTVTVEDE